ncbi:MAG: hypothetical protein HGA97_12450 [Chlorobiaceae bacterium]|nr:hypothetical protein [Chlorobiaceae bacterium]
MRENRLHGSEGGEARAFPTPIVIKTGDVHNKLDLLPQEALFCSMTCKSNPFFTDDDGDFNFAAEEKEAARLPP